MYDLLIIEKCSNVCDDARLPPSSFLSECIPPWSSCGLVVTA